MTIPVAASQCANRRGTADLGERKAIGTALCSDPRVWTCATCQTPLAQLAVAVFIALA